MQAGREPGPALVALDVRGHHPLFAGDRVQARALALRVLELVGGTGDLVGGGPGRQLLAGGDGDAGVVAGIQHAHRGLRDPPEGVVQVGGGVQAGHDPQHVLDQRVIGVLAPLPVSHCWLTCRPMRGDDRPAATVCSSRNTEASSTP